MVSRRKQHVETHKAIERSNRSLPRLLNMLMVRPEEFAERIRTSLKRGGDPRRLIKCVDDLEETLEARGVRMPAYFNSLRREAARARLQHARLKRRSL